MQPCAGAVGEGRDRLLRARVGQEWSGKARRWRCSGNAGTVSERVYRQPQTQQFLTPCRAVVSPPQDVVNRIVLASANKGPF